MAGRSTIWGAVRASAAGRPDARGRGFLAALLLHALILAALFAGGADAARAQPVSGEVKVTAANGFIRLVVTLVEEVELNVRMNGNILVISFKRPVNIAVGRIAAGAPDYFKAVRRDPDGTAIRIALGRKATINSMAAAERLFVDLLPENWTGLPPGLPADVIEDLARRAREAEKQLRQHRQQARPQPLSRVRVASNPTFVRYTFELPEATAVSSERELNSLKVSFASPIRFDLADVKADLPPTIQSIDSQLSADQVLVRFAFVGKVDVRTFREDNNFVIDVSGSDAKETRLPLPPNPPVPAAVLDPLGPGASSPTLAASAKPEPPLEKTVPAPAKPEPAQAKPEPAQAKAPPASPPAVAPVAPSPQPALSPPQPPAPRPVQAAQPPTQIATAPPAQPAAATPAQPSVTAQPPATPELKAAPPPVAPATPPASSPQSAKPEPAAESREPAKPIAPAATQPALQTPPVAPASSAPAVAATPATPPAPRDPNALPVEVHRQGDNLRIVFPFAEATPAAIFNRADTLWLVFDNKSTLDLAELEADTSKTIRSVTVTPDGESQVVRVRLERPRLASALPEGTSWIVSIGDTVVDPTRPLGIARSIIGPGRSSVTVPFEEPRQLHRIADPEIGDTVLVVTALGPARGLLKTQDFVEFRALATSHGVAIQPFADDLTTELAVDKVVITRPGGMTLSGATSVAPRAPASARNTPVYRPLMFDTQTWGFDRQANFNERQRSLIGAAAEAPASRRIGPRIDLARFYMSREMFTEAKAVLDVTLADEHTNQAPEDTTALVMRAVTNVMLDRPETALKELAHPLVGNLHDAPLWRALALARQGKWAEAREGMRTVTASLGLLPLELQRLALKEAFRAEIEVRDFASAANQLNELETIGIPHEMRAELSVLTGRLAQGLGKTQDALTAYRTAAESSDRPAAAAGRLREVVLRSEIGDMPRKDVIPELETLTAIWRGDDTEIEALQLLARLYTEEERYRDAFYVMRTAVRAHPNSELTRKIHDEAATTFDLLFLGGKGDSLPAIDALALFYDFRELTPIGRRGDEMIRRLSDRLVSVDLLGQAAELLQHQVGHRLQGAARAQIATRLAVIHLMNRKPEQAQATLRSTRVAELSPELRSLRLLLEARALSDIGRHDVALEVIANMDRREAIRLRSDILWAARRYGDSAEQIELLYGERWKEWDPLKDPERADIIRAAVGFALADDSIGLSRIREKYAAKMADSPDRRIFDIASAPIGTNTAEFREIAKIVAAVDTLEGFLRDLRANHPEVGALSPVAASAGPQDTIQKVAKSPPQTQPAH